MSNPIYPLKLAQNFNVYQNIFFNGINHTMGLGFSHGLVKKNRCQKNSNTSNAFVLVLILEGKATYTDHYGQKYSLEAGYGFLRIPNLSHILEISNHQYYSEAFIHIPKPFYMDIKKYGGSSEDNPVIKFDLKSTLIDQLLETAYLFSNALEKSLPIYLMEFYGYIIKFMQQSDLNTIPSFHLKLVEEVCLILDHSITENIKLPDIAKGFNISYERLRKVFKEVMKITMGEYRIKSRIQYAQTLLLKRDMNINQIAEYMGYPDSFSFSKQFKKERGVSPEKYLKNLLY